MFTENLHHFYPEVIQSKLISFGSQTQYIVVNIFTLIIIIDHHLKQDGNHYTMAYMLNVDKMVHQFLLLIPKKISNNKNHKHAYYTIICPRGRTRKINTKEEALFQVSKKGIGCFSDYIPADYRV